MKEIELVEKTVRVDNSDNAERKYRIEARVTVRNNAVTSINDGHVGTLDGGVYLAHFNGYGNLNVQFDSISEDRTAILEAIEEFYADLKAEEN